MSGIEIIATALGLACVWFTVRQNIWCWPTGLGMVALYIVIFWQAKLYSDMGLQVVYVFMQLYGWWYWLGGGNRADQRPVSRLGTARLGLWVGAGVLGTLALGSAMIRYTDAALPYWDATTTMLSLIAQWLLGRKVLESWLFWIVVDVLSIGIYLSKGLYLTAGLYTVFLGLAAQGYVAWLRSRQARAAATPA